MTRKRSFENIIRSRMSQTVLLWASIWVLSVLSLYIAFQLRFDFYVPAVVKSHYAFFLPVVAFIKLLVFIIIGGHRTNWRYVGLMDIITIGLFVIICAVIMYAGRFLGQLTNIPRGVILIDVILSFALVGGFRVAPRVVREFVLLPLSNGRSANLKNTIIIGAGDAGEMLLRDIKRNVNSPYKVCAFFDDNRNKHHMMIHGVQVKGTVEDIGEYIKETPVDLIILAIPSATGSQINKINAILKNFNVPVKTLPHIWEIIEGEPKTNQLRDINIADLLRREEVSGSLAQIRDLIDGKVIVVTGAGGSIGSELCRQIVKRKPEALIALDKSENSLFHLNRELTERADKDVLPNFFPILCDIRDESRLFDLFSRMRPNIIFHAAAHKHVGMQELNPIECFKNNLGGMQTLTGISDRMKVDQLVLVSTDKAVNPTSVMGASKRACELYCNAYAKISNTSFISVRFGNVLGSDGSVVPIFHDQIAKGGPITITHPDAERYFITIPEAVVLVLHAASLGKSGQILMLEMGAPIRILQLAQSLLNLTGMSSSKIDFEYIGLRPGEKLREELSCSGEVCISTSHKYIKIFNDSHIVKRQYVERMDELILKASSNGTDFDVRRALQDLVPEYQWEATSQVVVDNQPRSEPSVNKVLFQRRLSKVN